MTLGKRSGSRILGIDYGRVRIGLALSDPTKTIASPLFAMRRRGKLEETLATLMRAVEEFDVGALLMGLPLLLSGRSSEMTREAHTFAASLEKESGLLLSWWDERLTSKEVEKVLIDAGVKRRKRTQHLDTLSATLILQSYLNHSQST